MILNVKCERAGKGGRKERREDMDVKLSEHKRILSEYKYQLRKEKEKNWRQFVSVYSNLDSWDI